MKKRLLPALPSAITLTSVLFGLLSITWAAHQPFWAAVALVFAALCDCLDGRVARATKTQSDFGLQLDSLADAVSFGVAPANLLYVWQLQHLSSGPIDLGLIVVFVYTACGLIRLARFNVMASRPDAEKTFTGIPIPLAAMMLCGIVMASHELNSATFQRADLLAALVLVLSGLMVCNIRFPAFKRSVSLRHRMAFSVAVLLGLGLLVAGATVGVMLVAFCVAYILSGILPVLLRPLARRQ